MLAPPTNKLKAATFKALSDPQFHRRTMDLPDLFPWQVQIVNRVERAIDEHKAETICIRGARQGAGKNECFGMIAMRFLGRYARRGGTYIRTAPTWASLFANSQRRLERFLAADPITNNGVQTIQGFIYERQKANVIFYSSEKTTKVLGGTADACLDMDEAHVIDPLKFDEEFRPMVSATAAPIVLWGVAADQTDVLYKEMKRLKDDGHTDCVIEVPCDIVAEHNPDYALFVENEERRLGSDHPVFLTQYKLVDVQSAGGFFTAKQISLLFDGAEHCRIYSPRTTSALGQVAYYALIDIGGEDVVGRDASDVRIEKPQQDSTAAWIVEADFSIMHPWIGMPVCRVVDWLWLTGMPLPQQQAELDDWLGRWHISGGVIDARGLGEQVSSHITIKHPLVQAYKATPTTVHEDMSHLLAMTNSGLIRMPQDDGSEDFAELRRQFGWVGRRFLSGMMMKMAKPGANARGEGGDPTRHIDFPKALSYLWRSMGTGQFSFVSDENFLEGGF